MMPDSELPVVYELDMMSYADGDSLSACSYLIDWTVSIPNGARGTGFAAYGAGHLFRYRDGRLQEYHAGDDATPFHPGGDKAKGVQNRTQFADYLPQNIGLQLEAMSADSAYVYDVSRRGPTLVVSGVERVRGYDCREFTYVIDERSMLPVEIDFCCNPGLPSEQTVLMTYTGTSAEGCRPVTEDMLAAAYPDAFGKYRRDNYTLEHLPGLPMPTYSAMTLTGGRHTYNRGEAPGQTTVIAVLDSSVGSTAEVVEQLREAALLSSAANRLILAFVDTDSERIAAVTAGRAVNGEVILTGATKLARDCGVADTPSFIFCSPDGRVADILIGHNKRLAEDVIQKIALAR